MRERERVSERAEKEDMRGREGKRERKTKKRKRERVWCKDSFKYVCREGGKWERE